ncbi:MAG: phenylalanine--tRNA ligase subunit beta [Chloroflexi bacterium]|nr:phenylalanine--tRNA ligase subunit beta [Chloroflexota bacterium]MCH8892047.1 phenylalanine--tRNA ligase subunit beta [Chloroflexota bacterium]MCI0789538.1 phenylalanine--tRNA ligase subunit beta [Chloroflexota bacterium]MCI0800414.1 phenylalanine--tRNA ligase subunit beta [Chloroflexota bacterium]MCI0810404.1 phenylalanine--tRNA ligase subunit beta [Chloroflexota bacterium]
MRVPLSWLKQYVDIDLPAEELAHRLTMAGIEVGEVEVIGGWSEVFVGHVTDVRPHPNADRLRLCVVTTGAEQLEVVCGAPNVAAGQKICFAKVGANIYNTHTQRHETLEAAKIRGVESQGMICSAVELGLGDDHSGIIVLPDDAPTGTPLDEYLGDTVLDLELTPNRLDCLSVLGVAHEVAALTGKKVREPDASYEEAGAPITEQINISVADPDLCRRYTASLLQGVKIGPSPQWLQDRLTRAGLRPINNVVDVTNFVMLEYNQPLHSFDYDLIKDATIIVRRARPGELLTTLDGVERRLSAENLVIADANDAIGLGGVIGGANSEISDRTVNVLLESATFNGTNNRETAQSMGLRTEATLRFEKGLRPELAPIALRRATGLIHEIAGGTVAPGIVDVLSGEGADPPVVPLSSKKIKGILGMDVDLKRVQEILDALGFTWESTGDAELKVTVPYWRNDVNIEEDLVEEVVRNIGYDSVPTTMLSSPIPFQQPVPIMGLRDQIKDLLVAAGIQEMINYPLVTLRQLEQVEQLDPARPPLRIANPLSSDREYLRTTLRASLLGNLAANQGHSAGPFRMFEAGRVFLPRDGDLPEERETVAGVLAGLRHEPSWLEDQGLLDFYDAKGVVELVLDRLGVAATYEPVDDPAFHPGRCAVIKASESVLGMVGEVHPAVMDRLGLEQPKVAAFELYLEPIMAALPASQRQFEPLPRYPSATRDLALVMPSDVNAVRVTQLILRHRGVDRAELFDIYAGENIAEGTKSLAFHVYFQAGDRTLTNEEVNRSLEGLLRTLERELNATLRA